MTPWPKFLVWDTTIHTKGIFGLGLFRRIYRVRPISALLICLPVTLLLLWYAWKAYASFDSYRRFTKEDIPLTPEGFHIQLFDKLHHDFRRLSMPGLPSPSQIERFDFHLKGRNMEALLNATNRESRPYVSAELEYDNTAQDISIRLRGQKHWHLLGKKKSLKIKLPKGSLLKGHRVFNLIKDPSPFIVGEQIILNIARDEGILTPHSSFARVGINKADLGVYRFEAQPDESLLRQNQRMPGSIYSGNLPPSARTEELWNDIRRWKKVAWRNEEEKESRDDLKRLLQYIQNSSVREFVGFARREIDLELFALFEALDVIFGGDQHDFRQNHKLYFDPYKGRWEPIAWNFRGFKHDPDFNLVENPLLLRLKLIPEYLSLRNRILYELLVSKCSPSAVRDQTTDILKEIVPELASDSHWDAYKLLLRVDRFHRQMVRPMDLRKLALVFESEMTTFSQRHAYLMRELKKNPLYVQLEEITKNTYTLNVIVDGHTGVQIESIRMVWPKECQESSWQLYQEGLPLTPLSGSNQVTLSRPIDLFPGLVFLLRKNPGPKRGKIRTQTLPRKHSFQLLSSCRPEKVEVEGIHLATGSKIKSRAATPGVLKRQLDHSLKPDDVPEFIAGEIATHPWQLQQPQPEKIHIGPGTVNIPRTMVFATHQSVVVAPGTVMQMGQGASLIFLGQVDFQGSKTNPIIIKAVGKEPWGGLILQGPETSGSSLRNVHALGGTLPHHGLIPYPGMVNLHDTKNIVMRGCLLGHNQDSDDVVHAAYVDNLSVENTSVKNAAIDAFDLEFVSGKLSRVKVTEAKDEGLDLMGSRIELVDSIIIGCGGNGISAGEESSLKVRDTLIARAEVGVLAKNSSRVELSDSMIFQSQTGVRVYQRTVRYRGKSKLSSDVLFVVECKKISSHFLDLGRIQKRLPQAHVLGRLANDVLALKSWEELPVWVATQLKGKEK
jgi:hypothetical protein